MEQNWKAPACVQDELRLVVFARQGKPDLRKENRNMIASVILLHAPLTRAQISASYHSNVRRLWEQPEIYHGRVRIKEEEPLEMQQNLRKMKSVNVSLTLSGTPAQPEGLCWFWRLVRAPCQCRRMTCEGCSCTFNERRTGDVTHRNGGATTLSQKPKYTHSQSDFSRMGVVIFPGDDDPFQLHAACKTARNTKSWFLWKQWGQQQKGGMWVCRITADDKANFLVAGSHHVTIENGFTILRLGLVLVQKKKNYLRYVEQQLLIRIALNILEDMNIQQT